MEINYTRHSLKMLKKKRNQASRDEDSQKELRFTYFLADYLLKGKKKVGTANRLTETIRGKLNATD